MVVKQCIVSGCENMQGTRRRKLCNHHYRVLSQTGSLRINDSEMMTKDLTPCSIDSCERAARAKGMCMLHYSREYHFGDALLTSDPNYVPPTIESRFWKKVQKTDECWVWTGTTDEFGKGWFVFAGKSKSAHRYSYMHHYNVSEPLPRTVPVRQTCGNPSCVRPEHLKLATTFS